MVAKLEHFTQKYRGWRQRRGKGAGKGKFSQDNHPSQKQSSSSSSSGSGGQMQVRGKGKNFSSARFVEAVAETYMKMKEKPSSTKGSAQWQTKKKKQQQQRIRHASTEDGDDEDEDEEAEGDASSKMGGSNFDKEAFMARFFHYIKMSERNKDGFDTSYKRLHMAHMVTESCRVLTENGFGIYMDIKCSFSFFPLFLVAPFIVYRWQHKSVYSEAFGVREGGGVVCHERALIEVRVPLYSGEEAVVRLEGNLTDHPGAKHVLLTTPMICHLSGLAALVSAGREIVWAKLQRASPSAEFPFTTIVTAQRVSKV
uniref:Uncharacterized protein n=1 Tax=Chromera velia CCMP2878 TaxID=1169474 RepID=A0A0G4I2J8_9ALVE|eukprot:Cvel_10347.t1-p1 / transcript=Cvel_10347.t1 / gene=Cvel_10347 / organism=Chromera_velia_CCMP2878 / gene_product=hypothetical protein / transcript_product=hypothetical protein / location=Cvel_scaffold622:10007-10939(-) / protein_length=311 / sequence_SO=supercontig / SO=protein_coding / is_pseudo=false